MDNTVVSFTSYSRRILAFAASDFRNGFHQETARWRAWSVPLLAFGPDPSAGYLLIRVAASPNQQAGQTNFTLRIAPMIGTTPKSRPQAEAITRRKYLPNTLGYAVHSIMYVCTEWKPCHLCQHADSSTTPVMPCQTGPSLLAIPHLTCQYASITWYRYASNSPYAQDLQRKRP